MNTDQLLEEIKQLHKQVRQLTHERNDVMQMYCCNRVALSEGKMPEEIAAQFGWDCFNPAFRAPHDEYISFSEYAYCIPKRIKPNSQDSLSKSCGFNDLKDLTSKKGDT